MEKTGLEKFLDIASGEEKVKVQVSIRPTSMIIFGIILLITWILIFTAETYIKGRKT